MTNQLDTAVLVAVLAGCGLYLCLSRRFLRVLFGFLMLSSAANLVLLSVSGDPSARTVPVVGTDQSARYADPLPQALILTAIVIGLAVASFLAVLLYRLHTDRGVTTLNGLESAPAPGSPAQKEEETS